MRVLSKDDRKKRGCRYCADRKSCWCKHDECPYHELDDVETYEDYYISEMGLFNWLFEAEETDDYY